MMCGMFGVKGGVCLVVWFCMVMINFVMGCSIIYEYEIVMLVEVV